MHRLRGIHAPATEVVHIAEVLHAAARRRGIRTPATEVVHIAEDLHAAARRRGRDRAVSRA